ncbi:MAG: hypothetical protein FD174_448 [Geobacteraceae bacterium]|nr:MAG: hypothetical protein FD174_448 [Geobacteraceae bacterium]
MKLIVGIAGVILVLMAPYTAFLEHGLEPAFLFLGWCLCTCALACVVNPPLEKLVTKLDMVYSNQQAERFIARQQELIQKAADQALQEKESRRISG